MAGVPQLEPYDPGEPCPECSAEGAVPYHHPVPIFLVFGSGKPWPCSGRNMTQAGEHMCIKCVTCSFAWMRSVNAGVMAFPGNEGP